MLLVTWYYVNLDMIQTSEKLLTLESSNPYWWFLCVLIPEDIRPWIGPDGKEIKPACVQKLEDVAREHNFVSRYLKTYIFIHVISLIFKLI